MSSKAVTIGAEETSLDRKRAATAKRAPRLGAMLALGVACLVFSLIHVVPGDPVEVMLGESARPADRDEPADRQHDERCCRGRVRAGGRWRARSGALRSLGRCR